MRVLVMGSGGLGGYYGGALAQAGHDVTFLARGAHLAAMRERGLTIRGGDQPIELRPVKAVGSPAEAGSNFDLVLFTVKGYDARGAAEALKPAVGPNTAVLTLLNGVESVDILSETLGPEHVLSGMTVISANIAEPGVISLNGPTRRIVLGEMSGQRTARVQQIADALRAVGVDVTIGDDPLLIVWEKYAAQATAASMTTVCDATFGAIRETPEGLALFKRMIGETVAVGRALGVKLPADIEERALGILMSMPASHKTSMQRDFERHGPNELEPLTGYIVRRGREVGVPTPSFDVVYAILKTRASQFLSARNA